jgi:hypothetical protein
MPYSPKYITADDLADALSPKVLLEIFDDNNTNDLAAVKASSQVLLILENAEGQVDSRLTTEYDVSQLVGSDRLIRRAALEYAVGYSYERHPEVVRSAQAPERIKRADDLVQRIQDAIQMLPDNPDDKPKNVGGALYDPSPLMWTNPDGSYAGGDY